MSWVVIIMDLVDNKVKINWFYQKRVALDIVREDQFLYILLWSWLQIQC